MTRRRGGAGPVPRRGGPAGGYRSQRHGLVALDDCDRSLRPAILWNDQRTTAECEQIEEAVGPRRLIEHEPEDYARIARSPAQRLRAPAPVRRARDRRLRRLGDAAARGRRAPLERRGARRARGRPVVAAARAREPRGLRHHARRGARSPRRGRPGGGRPRRRRRSPRADVRRARHLGGGLPRSRAIRRRPTGPRPSLLSRNPRGRGARRA